MLRTILLTLGLLIFPATALAYPTSVVFTPTGEAKAMGDVGLLAYSATNLSPRVSPSSSWFGFEAGLLPQWKYGGSGLSFGGLEIGLDLITPFGDVAKPVLNAKLGLFTEGTYSPSVAVGVMEISPALPSMNYVYASATKTLRASADVFSYGRITLGYGVDTGSRAAFMGTAPFQNTRSALMACYESLQLLDRIGLAIDYLGGASEISDTYVGVTFALTPVTTLAAGAIAAPPRPPTMDSSRTYRLDSTWANSSTSQRRARGMGYGAPSCKPSSVLRSLDLARRRGLGRRGHRGRRDLRRGASA